MEIIHLRIDDLTNQIHQTINAYQNTDVSFLIAYIKEIGRNLTTYTLEFIYPTNFVMELKHYQTTVKMLYDIMTQLNLLQDEDIMRLYSVYDRAVNNVDLLKLL